MIRQWMLLLLGLYMILAGHRSALSRCQPGTRNTPWRCYAIDEPLPELFFFFAAGVMAFGIAMTIGSAWSLYRRERWQDAQKLRFFVLLGLSYAVTWLLMPLIYPRFW